MRGRWMAKQDRRHIAAASMHASSGMLGSVVRVLLCQESADVQSTEARVRGTA